MDSITQIALGAVVGEAVLGKKLGNRALWWGGVAGTIPDLDVMANLFFPEMLALAYHRHITHSILFALIGGLAFAWLIHNYYERGVFRKPWMVNIKGFLFVIAIVFYTALMVGISWWLRGVHALLWLIPLSVLIFFLARYYVRSFILTLHHPPHGVSLWNWFALFFWCFLTHVLLDVFTPYGTQVFQPFSDYRAAFNNIAVVDPLYTLPLLIAIGMIVFLRRTQALRIKIYMAGLIISSMYMAFTISNKLHINQIFENSLIENGIEVNRYTTAPGIFTNFLWNAVAETDSTFITADYSNFDPTRTFSNFRVYPKNHHFISDYEHIKEVGIVRWFSKGYFKVDMSGDPNKLYMTDLRYGSLGRSDSDEPESVFRFHLILNEGKAPEVGQSGDRPEINRAVWNAYWSRVYGNPGALKPR